MRLWIKPVEAGEGEQACNLQGVRAVDAENAAPQAVDKAAVLASCGMLSLFVGNCLAGRA